MTKSNGHYISKFFVKVAGVGAVIVSESKIVPYGRYHKVRTNLLYPDSHQKP